MRLLVPVAFVLLFLVLAIWDGRVVGEFVASTMSRSVGGNVTIERFDWTGWGRARIDGLTLTAPDWQGEGAEIASIKSVRLSFDPVSLLWGPLHVTAFDVAGLQVNFVENPSQQNFYNIQMLQPAGWSGHSTGSATTLVDSASLTDVALSFKRLTKNGIIDVGGYSGSFSLRPDLTGMRSIIELKQNDGPVRVAGWINQHTLEFDLTADGLEVNKNLALVLPRYLRAIAEDSDAVGRVTHATLSYSKAKQFQGTMEFADIRATLPRGELGRWVRYEDGQILPSQGFPQFQLRSGKIELDGSRIEFRNLDFDLVNTAADGRVATLPVRASLMADFAALPAEDFQWENRAAWMAKLRDLLPFELNISIPNFELGNTAQNAAMELPEAAAQFLHTFHVAQMTFDFGYTAKRVIPTVNANGELVGAPIETSGTLVITDGRGAFDGFPYPLTKVQSTVRFDGSTATIGDLRGTAPGGDTVLVQGKVTNMSDDFGVDISVATASAPVDPVLLDCFPAASRAILGSLFWKEGFERLQADGLLFDAAQVESAQSKLPLLEQRLRELSSDSATDPTLLSELSTHIGQIRRTIDRGAFYPGGRVAFTLRVQRPEKDDADVTVTGSIRILQGDILPTMFPYPVRTTGGEIKLLADRIDLGDGIPFRALDGATGMFGGTIDLVQTGSTISFAPHLTFSLDHDRMGPLFYVAIPPDSDQEMTDWPGKTLSTGGKLLSMLDVRGDLTISGAIATDSHGELDLSCRVDLARGSVHPSLQEDDPLQSTGLIWPTGFGLDDCVATIQIADDRVEIESFAGFRGEGRIEASGIAALNSSLRDFEIRLRQVQLADYAVNLVPFNERPEARKLWDRYQPTGCFDADIRLASTAASPELVTELIVTPSQLGLQLKEGPIGVQFHQGKLRIHEEDVACDALSATIVSPGGMESHLCLDGAYGTATGALEFAGSVDNGIIHGPLIEEILDLTQSVGASSMLHEFDPHGRYDAEFSYRSADEFSHGGFDLDARLTELSLGSATARLDLLLDTPARIQTRGQEILLHPMRAGFVGGWLDAAGWMSTDPDGSIQGGLFDISVVAHGTGSQLVAALPASARGPITGIGFECHDTLEAHAQIELERRESLTTRAHAVIDLADASIEEAPGVAELTCHLDCEFHDDATSKWFYVESDGAAMKLAGRTLTDARVRIGNRNSPSGEIRGDLLAQVGSGMMDVSASIAPTSPFRYQADIAVAGCDLAALTLVSDGVPATAPPPTPSDPGLVDARFSISGNGSGIDSRLGRGSALVQKADLARLPIALALLQITQLSLTLDSTVSKGEFDFAIDGERLFFDRFDLTCKDLILKGNGWLDTESGQLALRLRNRGTVPILSDILSPVSNQLFQIDVRGTLANPIGDLAPLPGFVPPPTLPPESPIARLP